MLKEYDPEKTIKGRMAECLVEELLKHSGNKVYRFGYEAVMQNLSQMDEAKLDHDSEIGRKIRITPDFIVVNKNNVPYFIEVKFRTDARVWERDIKLIESFWEAKIIMVTVSKPYFRILDTKKGNRKWIALEKDRALDIDGIVLGKCNKLVEKYYIQKKS